MFLNLQVKEGHLWWKKHLAFYNLEYSCSDTSLVTGLVECINSRKVYAFVMKTNKRDIFFYSEGDVIEGEIERDKISQYRLSATSAKLIDTYLRGMVCTCTRFGLVWC